MYDKGESDSTVYTGMYTYTYIMCALCVCLCVCVCVCACVHACVCVCVTCIHTSLLSAICTVKPKVYINTKIGLFCL